MIKDNWLAASVHVANFLPNNASVLGFVGDFDVTLKAPVKENVIQGTMSVVGQPDLNITVRLTKKANL